MDTVKANNNREVVTAPSDKSEFFDELKRMRENWRIRKVNDLIFGDLGYKICEFPSGDPTSPKMGPSSSSRRCSTCSGPPRARAARRAAAAAAFRSRCPSI